MDYALPLRGKGCLMSVKSIEGKVMSLNKYI